MPTPPLRAPRSCAGVGVFFVPAASRVPPDTPGACDDSRTPPRRSCSSTPIAPAADEGGALDWRGDGPPSRRGERERPRTAPPQRPWLVLSLIVVGLGLVFVFTGAGVLAWYCRCAIGGKRTDAGSQFYFFFPGGVLLAVDGVGGRGAATGRRARRREDGVEFTDDTDDSRRAPPIVLGQRKKEI